MTLAVGHQQLIHPLRHDPAAPPLRCSGCCRSSSHLGPEVMFLDFSMACDRGCVIEVDGGAVVEMLTDMVLCAECVADGTLLLDPTLARTWRRQVAEEKARLTAEIAHFSKARAQAHGEWQKCEARLEEIRARGVEVDELRAAVEQWAPLFDRAIEVFREERLRVWALERVDLGVLSVSSAGDEAAEVAAELADARKVLDRARRALRALRTTGERLMKQSETHGLQTEWHLIKNRLDAAGDETNVR